MVRKLCVDLARLARAWWRVDRVRISPQEGVLLRLRPPCVVVVGARPAEVLSRTTGQSAAGPFVLYQCRSAVGDCQLRVTPLAAGRVLLVNWHADGIECAIDPSAVEVFGAVA